MRVAIRSAGVVLIALVSAALLAVTTATSALAATVLMVGGVAAGELPDWVMKEVLGRAYSDDATYDRVNVAWPAQAGRGTGPDDLTLGQSIAVGTNNLDAAIAAAVATGEPVTVVGMSAGALVVDEELRRLASRTNAPGASQLTFVMVADSSRQSFINESQYNSDLDYTYQPPPDTKYNIIVVTGEYDGAADFPDRPWNLLAVVNAIVGAVVVHVPVMFADLSKVPADNITTTVNSVGGRTMHYLVPTDRLPLVQLFPSLAPIEGLLKQWVDAGYSRNDQRAVTSATASALTTETQFESSTLTADVPVGALTERVSAGPEASQSLVDAAEEPATATDGLATAPTEEPAQADELLDVAEEPATATDGLAKAPTEGPALDSATEAVSDRVTDLTDGKKQSPSTKAGTTQSSKAWKPGDGIRAVTGVMQQLFAGKTARTPTTTETPASDTSTAKGSESSSATSASADGGTTTP